MVRRDSGKKDIAVTVEFFGWLQSKRKGAESSIEDCLRRLTGYKKRKRAE